MPEPAADVQSHTKFFVSDPADVLTLGTRSTVGAASVAGFMRINGTAEPPSAAPVIPVIVRSSGSATLTSTFGGSLAFARSVLFAPDGSALIDLSASNGQRFQSARSTPMQVGALYPFEITATCAASAGRHPAVTDPLLENDCQAIVDPGFELDQAAFDAMMGATTFPLADFFAIDLSANILAALSEPTLAALWALAATTLALRKRSLGRVEHETPRG